MYFNLSTAFIGSESRVVARARSRPDTISSRGSLSFSLFSFLSLSLSLCFSLFASVFPRWKTRSRGKGRADRIAERRMRGNYISLGARAPRESNPRSVSRLHAWHINLRVVLRAYARAAGNFGSPLFYVRVRACMYVCTRVADETRQFRQIAGFDRCRNSNPPRGFGSGESGETTDARWNQVETGFGFDAFTNKIIFLVVCLDSVYHFANLV